MALAQGDRYTVISVTRPHCLLADEDASPQKVLCSNQCETGEAKPGLKLAANALAESSCQLHLLPATLCNRLPLPTSCFEHTVVMLTVLYRCKGTCCPCLLLLISIATGSFRAKRLSFCQLYHSCWCSFYATRCQCGTVHHDKEACYVRTGPTALVITTALTILRLFQAILSTRQRQTIPRL